VTKKPAPNETVRIETAVFVRNMPLAAGKIMRIGHTVWDGEGAGPAQVSVAVVGDRRMAKLTDRYVGRAYRTDVLAFELSDRTDDEFVGQVVINSQLARDRARRLKTDPGAELALYLIHGLLHLVGYDDRTGDGARRMHRLALTYLRETGFKITAGLLNLAPAGAGEPGFD